MVIPSGRGDYNPATAPDRFISDDVLKLSSKDSRPILRIIS